MFNKLSAIIMILMLSFSIYVYYSFSDTCRTFEQISRSKESQQLSKDLYEYLNDTNILKFVFSSENRYIKMYDYWEFDEIKKIQIGFNKYGLDHNEHIYFIVNKKKDGSIDHTSISSFGIYSARAMLLFRKKNDEFISRAICKAYSDNIDSTEFDQNKEISK